MSRRLWVLIMVMMVFGLMVLSSASSVQATKQFGASTHFWLNQLTRGVLPGLLLMFLFWRFDYRRLKPFAFPILVGAFLLMMLVFVPGLGLHLKGATSWLSFGFVSFQPAEALKLALVLYLAAWLGERGDRLQHVQFGLLPFALVMGVVAILLLSQPDLGTLGVVSLIALGMYFFAGAPLKQLALIGAALLVVGGIFAMVSPERMSRITTIFHPSADTRGAGWQLNQSLVAIGSGGVFGKGFGQSTQKFGFLPEPIGDSIFAVLVEELGVVGGIGTLMAFLVLAYMLMSVARRAPDGFGGLVASGMCLWIMVQAVVNMMAITGIGPLTGVPLPFISYGGSSMAFMLAGLGIVLNIAKHE